MASLLSVDKSLLQWSRTFPHRFGIFERRCRGRDLPVSHHLTVIGSFTGKPATWIHHREPSQPGFSSFISLQLCFQPTPQSRIPMKSVLARSLPVQKSQLSYKFVKDVTWIFSGCQRAGTTTKTVNEPSFRRACVPFICLLHTYSFPNAFSNDVQSTSRCRRLVKSR